jgi:hypothetical protein
LKVLRGMALGLVGFFLFIALPILGLAFTINSTLLSPQFITSEIDKLDITTAAQEVLAEQLPSDYKPYMAGIDQSLIELKPWITESIHQVINDGYDYLLGSTDTFHISISTGPAKQSLVKNLTQSFVQSPPPQYLQLSPSDRSQYLDQVQQGTMQMIPATLEITQDTIGPQNMQTLQQAGEIIRYFRTGYYYLIAFSILLVLLIVLIFREIKGATRTLGIILLIDGAFSMIAFLICKQFVPGLLTVDNLPLQLQTWLPQVAEDFLAPWGIFNLVILAIGAILLVASFLYHSRKPVLSQISPV